MKEIYSVVYVLDLYHMNVYDVYNSKKRNYIHLIINDAPVKIELDAGASVSVMPDK